MFISLWGPSNLPDHSPKMSHKSHGVGGTNTYGNDIIVQIVVWNTHFNTDIRTQYTGGRDCDVQSGEKPNTVIFFTPASEDAWCHSLYTRLLEVAMISLDSTGTKRPFPFNNKCNYKYKIPHGLCCYMWRRYKWWQQDSIQVENWRHGLDLFPEYKYTDTYMKYRI